jgi:hypothetical protein
MSILEDPELVVVADTDDDDPDLDQCERCSHPRYMHVEGDVCGGCGTCKLFKPM